MRFFCACLRVCEIVSAFFCEFSLGAALLQECVEC